MPPMPPTPMLCPRCRRLIDHGEARCPHCGLPLPGSLAPLGGVLHRLHAPQDFVRGLIWVNAVLFVLSILFSAGGPRLSIDPLTFLAPDTRNLVRLGASGTLPIDQMGRWWTLISASYLHGGLLHILFNMSALRQLALLIIREFGTYRMFTIYTLAGIAGFFTSYLAGVPLTVGASAGLCGLVGAALYYGKRRGGIYGRAVYRQTSGWIVGLILIGLMPGINNWAHGGGLVAGMAAAWGLDYLERRAESLFDRLLGGLLMLVTAAVLAGAVISTVYYRFG